MSKKMISCRTCGADIAKSAKVCPGCGAKQKKPIYKRWWLWALVVLFVIGMMPGGEEGQVEAGAPGQSQTEPKQTEPAPEIEYKVFTVKQLMDDLKSNAMKAEQTYNGQYVELTGQLQVIDSDGKYISIIPPDSFTLIGVKCNIRNEEQRAAVMEMQAGDIITVRGKITSVGEVTDYSMNIDAFVTE